jgi:hypothetical protein
LPPDGRLAYTGRMTGAVEAAGTVGEGALWARAVESGAGEAHGTAHGTHCLNCGAALIGRYCHECGQSAHVHRTLGSIAHDLLHGVFHFEGKIWRTLPMLALRPGALTRRYIDGERARFVSPLALFLFTVFLMFAVISAIGPGDLSKSFQKAGSNAAVQLEEERAEGAAALARLERERAALAAAGKPTADMDRRIAEARADLATLARFTRNIEMRSGAVEAKGSGQVKVEGLNGAYSRAWKKAKENPGLLIYKVQSAAYKFSWALILLSTPMVALLFLWRRRFGLYDHATFVTYSISFMSLLAILVTVLIALGLRGAVIGWIVALVPPVHIFAQLRGAYGLRWFSALWRTVALLMFSAAALLLFVLGVVALNVGA